MSKKWISTARVRFTQFAREKYSKDYARQEIAITKQFGCDVLAFFAELDGWAMYPSKYAEMHSAIGKHDLLGEIREICKQQKIKFVACFMGMHCQTYHVRKHPEWCVKHHSSVFPDSPFAGYKRETSEKDILSLSSPYRQVLLGEVTEVLKNYQPDGIYFDGIYHPPGYDYSKWARDKFRQRFGREVPEDWFDPDWQEWHGDQYVDFARDVHELIAQHCPAAGLIIDNHGPTVGTLDSGENVPGAAKYLDAALQESYFECSGESPRFVAREALVMAAEARCQIWGARWCTRSPGHLPVSIPKATVMTWLCDAVSTGTAPVIVDQGGFWHDRTLQKPIKNRMTQLKKLQKLLGTNIPLPHVAIFHSMNRKVLRMNEDLALVRAPEEGLFRVLEEAHIPVSLVTESDILDGCLDEFASLVIPGVEEISDDVANCIESFVAKGGGLVSTFRTSFKDETGKERKRPALADVFGIKKIMGHVVSRATFAGFSYARPSVKVPAFLFNITRRHPITQGLLSDNVYAYAGKIVEAEMVEDTISLAHTVKFDEEEAKKNLYFLYTPTREISSGLVFARKHGRGRVVWIAGDIDRAVWEMGNPESATLLANATRWVTRRKAPVECTAPALITMRLRHNPKTHAIQIGLTNYASSQIFTTGFPGALCIKGPMQKKEFSRTQWPVHISPVDNVLLKVDWPCKTLPKIETITGNVPRIRRVGDEVEIKISRIEEGEVIVLAP